MIRVTVPEAERLYSLALPVMHYRCNLLNESTERFPESFILP